jgi:hypothetical protein
MFLFPSFIRNSLFDKPLDFNAHQHFLLNLNEEDLWNIDFEFYTLSELAYKYHQQLLAYENLIGEEIF